MNFFRVHFFDEDGNEKEDVVIYESLKEAKHEMTLKYGDNLISVKAIDMDKVEAEMMNA